MEDPMLSIDDYELAIVYKLLELVETYSPCKKESNLATYYKHVLFSSCKNNNFVYTGEEEYEFFILDQVFNLDNNNQIASLVVKASNYTDMYDFTQHAYFTCQVIISEAIGRLCVGS